MPTPDAFLSASGVRCRWSSLRSRVRREDVLRQSVEVVPDERMLAIGQTRVWWDDAPQTPGRSLPFSDTTMPVLDCASLAVMRAFFNRTGDWPDLDAIAAAGQLDVGAVAASSVSCSAGLNPTGPTAGVLTNPGCRHGLDLSGLP